MPAYANILNMKANRLVAEFRIHKSRIQLVYRRSSVAIHNPPYFYEFTRWEGEEIIEQREMPMAMVQFIVEVNDLAHRIYLGQENA